jgi:hypothetical protein
MIKLNIITYIIVVSISDINIYQMPNSSSIICVGATKILKDIENLSLNNGSTIQPPLEDLSWSKLMLIVICYEISSIKD